MITNNARFTVIGAGHGGKAMAADLAAKAFKVNLFNRTPSRIETITLNRTIELEYEDNSVRRCKLAAVTSDIAEALEDTDVIMVVVPASGHRDVARLCAPHLRDGHVIVLNPGRTGGALEFRGILNQLGVTADISIAETGTFVFVSRSTGPSQAHIFRHKNSVPLSLLGVKFGVETRTMDAIIRLGSIVQGVDFYQQGRSVADMGLEGMDLNQLKRYV